MDITELTLRLLFLFLPGIISVLIIEDRTTHKKWESYRFILYSFLNGLICYLILQICYFTGSIFKIVFDCFKTLINHNTVVSFQFFKLQTWSNLFNGSEIPYYEILLACLVSIIWGLIMTFAIEKKYLYTFTKNQGISSKFGDESLFYNFSGLDSVSEVYFHDVKNNLTYHGCLSKYSEDENNREILLQNVMVYKYDDAKYLYSVNQAYICKSINDEFLMEIPEINLENGKEN